jgi:hypothetical protein
MLALLVALVGSVGAQALGSTFATVALSPIDLKVS